ncbi:MAG: hypothetical protein M3R29_04925 [Verrucomicrobiota bacterium]|nr:hypothetical protein [Verrucomicrobiota bacterium]
MKWLAVFAFVLLQCSCTTLVNRRDLYSPEPAPGVRLRVTQTTTTTHTEQIEVPAPQFR